MVGYIRRYQNYLSMMVQFISHSSSLSLSTPCFDIDRRDEEDMEDRENMTRATPGMRREDRDDMTRPNPQGDREDGRTMRRSPAFCTELVCGPDNKENCQEFKFEDGRPQRALCIPLGGLNFIA